MRLAGRLGLVVLLTVATNAQGQQTEPEEAVDLSEVSDFDELDLDELLEGTRKKSAHVTPSLITDTSIVTVIKDEEIRQLGARILRDVLQTVAGLDVLTDNWGRNRIGVRGLLGQGSSENVLILFDGHRLNEQISGGATFVNLDIPVFNLKRIEIVKNPSSALFGANAFSAVINLISYSAAQFDGFEISVEGGSFTTQRYSLLAAQTIGDLGLSGAFQFADSEGPELFLPADSQTVRDSLLQPLGVAPASLAPGFTTDDRRSYDFNFDLIYKGFDLMTRITEQKSGGFIGKADAFGTVNQFNGRQILVGVSQRFALGDSVSGTGRFSFTQNEIQELANVYPPGYARPQDDGSLLVFPQGVIFDTKANSRRYEGDLRFDYEIPERNKLTLGVSFEQEKTYDLETRGNFDYQPPTILPSPSLQVQPFTTIPDQERMIASAFVQDQLDISPRVAIRGGLRFDHYDDFGDALNPSAGLLWRLSKRYHLNVSYGRAFRAPSFYELFANYPEVLQGNPALEPSTVNSFEVEFGYTRRNIRLRGNFFANYIRDFIAQTPALGSDLNFRPRTYVNIPEINIRGFEFEFKNRISPYDSFSLNYTYQDAENNITGEQLADIPQHLFNYITTFGYWKYLGVTSTLLVRSNRPRSALEVLRPDDLNWYAVWNLNFRLINFLDTVEISALVNNVTNVTYFEPAPFGSFPEDYPRPGRSFSFRFTYKY